MQKTGIEYLTHTCNPIAMRCTKCSDGCLNCWHLKTADRLCKNMALPEDERNALDGTGPFIMRERELSAIGKVKNAVIGVQFMGDLFHEDVPFEFIYKVYTHISNYPKNTYLILTKRSDRMVKMLQDVYFHLNRNGIYETDFTAWHGLTVCNQQEADEKIPIFLQVPGKKFLSIEPMLGAVDIVSFLPATLPALDRAVSGTRGDCLNAVILGGETGPGARPLHPDWVRSVRDQCQSAGVPFFFKSWGAWLSKDQLPVYENGLIKSFKTTSLKFSDGSESWYCGNKKSRILDGRFHNDLPWVKK